MIVWFAENAARGERWQPTQADAKRVRNGGPIAQQTVAEGGREMMCNLLNNCERPEEPALVTTEYKPLTEESLEAIRQSNTPEAQARARELMRPGYESPFSAATCIAGIDAGMCAAAIRQMDGTNLAKIGTAYLERLKQLQD